MFIVDNIFILWQSIRRSECPVELEPADRRTSVHVNLVRREEDYPVHCPFQQPIFLYIFLVSHMNYIVPISSPTDTGSREAPRCFIPRRWENIS